MHFQNWTRNLKSSKNPQIHEWVFYCRVVFFNENLTSLDIAKVRIATKLDMKERNYKSCENPQIRKWVFYCGQPRLKWEAGMKERGPTTNLWDVFLTNTKISFLQIKKYISNKYLQCFSDNIFERDVFLELQDHSKSWFMLLKKTFGKNSQIMTYFFSESFPHKRYLQRRWYAWKSE